MASASSAAHLARPLGLIDIRKPGDYPIVLGESLRAADQGSQLLNLRYNWQPKSGFSGSQSTIKPVKDGYRLTVEDRENEPSFIYSGHNRPVPADASDDSSALALVFDKKESVFKLEAIAKSIDLNLESTSSKINDATKRPKLPRSPAKPPKLQENGDAQPSPTDDSPDSSNPYNFRNFLAEAKEIIEKTPQLGAGSRTPLPGNRTPMNGFASPIPGASRFKATTPQFTPTSTSSSKPKKRKTDNDAPKKPRLASPVRQKPSSAQKPLKKRKPPATSPPARPASKGKVEDSDDELSDTIVVARNHTNPSSSQSLHQPARSGHARTVSSNVGRSPHIVVKDGDLEIDMGSPPPETRGRPRGRIDTGAFRSGTGTPIMTGSSKFDPSRRREENRDITMRDIEGDDGEGEGKGSDEEDGDVEEFDLGSPRALRGVEGSRSESTVEATAHQYASRGGGEGGENAPTPMNVDDEEDDDEDLLAKEFEAALEEEGKVGEEGYGLGISGAVGQRVGDDEESEVSEEE